MVVSDVNNKTIVVNVQRRYKHPVYKKFMTQTKKYHAHDELNAAKVGDQVTIIEARPFSAKKRWELLGQRRLSSKHNSSYSRSEEEWSS